jgi:Sulfotransferase domain
MPDATSSLPAFVVIGATASGTETLHAWLNDHRDVCMSPREGLDFFLEDGTWDKGVGWYALRFGNCRWDQARGESSPRYADTHLDPGVPKRMHSVLPDAKLIYLVREPMERMRALYRQRVADGLEDRSFEEGITTDPEYVAASRYIEHVGAFLKEYKKKQLLVITTEQLAADPQKTLAAVHAHIGVSTEPLSADKARREVTADQRSDSTISRRLKANPAYWRALNRSWELRTWHERIFTRKSHVAPTPLSRQADADLRAGLEKDTQALEVFVGRRLTEWGR